MRKKSLQQVEELLERQRLLLEGGMERLVPAPPAARSGEPVVVTKAEPPSAQAFDALRQSVESAKNAVHTHQAHLAIIHRALLRAGGPKAPLLLVNDLMRQAGIRLEWAASRRDLFTDHSGSASSETSTDYEVSDPAYIDELTGRVVQQGILTRRTEVPA